MGAERETTCRPGKDRWETTMSYETIEFYVGNETLIVHKCWCGVSHAISESLHRLATEKGKVMYCPLGHEWFIRETTVDRLRKKLQKEEQKLCRERARHDQTRAELKDTEHRRRAQKAATTRIVNRVSRGVCPCCNRSFVNLLRHMTSKHPDYSRETAKS